MGSEKAWLLLWKSSPPVAAHKLTAFRVAKAVSYKPVLRYVVLYYIDVLPIDQRRLQSPKEYMQQYMAARLMAAHTSKV